MGYDGWKVIIVGIHSQPCSEYIFVALGINIYLALGIMTCLVIGLWVWKLDSNCCSFLLSPTAPTPRTKVIGESVARFARPFESRPADPVRREVFRQLAANPDTASTSGWVTPSSSPSCHSSCLFRKALKRAPPGQCPLKPRVQGGG